MIDLLTIDDVAIEMGLSYDHTRKLLRDSGTLPVQVIGRNKFYTSQQVQALKTKKDA